jgi:hypothetical protein
VRTQVKYKCTFFDANRHARAATSIHASRQYTLTHRFHQRVVVDESSRRLCARTQHSAHTHTPAHLVQSLTKRRIVLKCVPNHRLEVTVHGEQCLHVPACTCGCDMHTRTHMRTRTHTCGRTRAHIHAHTHTHALCWVRLGVVFARRKGGQLRQCNLSWGEEAGDGCAHCMHTHTQPRSNLLHVRDERLAQGRQTDVGRSWGKQRIETAKLGRRGGGREDWCDSEDSTHTHTASPAQSCPPPAAHRTRPTTLRGARPPTPRHSVRVSETRLRGVGTCVRV